MKDKLKTGGGVFKGLIKTGGEVADKMLDKGADVATDMMKHVTGLISKLSDDIGLMAKRILTMEERIGLMADRIVKTEQLMANLTAKLANKDLPISTDEFADEPILPFEVARDWDLVLSHNLQDYVPMMPLIVLYLTDGFLFVLVSNRVSMSDISEGCRSLSGICLLK